MREATFSSPAFRWHSVILFTVGLVAAFLFMTTGIEENFWVHLVS